MLELPEILNIPDKLLPVITGINDYKFIVIEGGRGSSKTQSIGRLILYIAEQRRVRVFNGREVQNTIEESVYTVLKDLIANYNLAFQVQKNGITHLVTGSELKFKGFREQGASNIKGTEGADIIWVDEAQTLTKVTLDMLVPTVRKNNAKIIFTLNRYMRDDAVMELVGRPDCLHIKINFYDNQFCPLTLKIEAEECRRKSERDYNHIWLGEPLDTADDYLFNYAKLQASYDIKPFGETPYKQRIMGIDFAAQGNDQCVATILDRMSNTHWQVTEQIAWDEPDAMISTGKIVNLIARHRPTISLLDVGGMGHVVWNRLNEVGVTVQRFDGATTQGVDVVHYANARAEMYYILKDWFDSGFLCLDKERDKMVVSELEKIKMKSRSDGRRILQPKQDMKKELRYSPDRADSLAMAVYGAVKFLGNANNYTIETRSITRKTGSSRRR